MQLTMRDIEILRFINDFGFCEMPHISKHFNLRNPRNYQIISRLIRADLVKAEKIFFANNRILSLTMAGARHTNLPPISQVSLSRYNHNSYLIDVYMKLARVHPAATWLSERQLYQDKYSVGGTRYRHVPDGLLIFPEDKQIAIEIELTSKAKQRWEQIFNAYASDLSVSEVWYYCPRSIINPLRKLADDKKGLIKIFDIDSFLA